MVAYILVMSAMTIAILWTVWYVLFGRTNKTKNLTVKNVEEELATLKSKRASLSDEVEVVEEMVVVDDKIEKLEDRVDQANEKRKS